MYWDAALSGQEIEALSGSVWDQEKIDYFNRYLPVSPEAKFALKDWYIVIPAKAMEEFDIKINPGMKWLIKKESWNVLLSTETYMNLPTTLVGTVWNKDISGLPSAGDSITINVSSVDVGVFKQLGVHLTCEPRYEGNKLYHS